jgi:hypothetical protein
LAARARNGEPTQYEGDLRARYEILTNAWEDCWWAGAFRGNLLDVYAYLGAGAARSQIYQLFRELLEGGLIRLHRGDQCAAERRETVEYDIRLEELDRALDEVFAWESDGVREVPHVWLCDTDLTNDAWKEVMDAMREIGAELGR